MLLRNCNSLKNDETYLIQLQLRHQCPQWDAVGALLVAGGEGGPGLVGLPGLLVELTQHHVQLLKRLKL